MRRPDNTYTEMPMMCQVQGMSFHFCVEGWKGEGPLLRVCVDIGGIKGEERLLPQYQRTGVRASHFTVLTAVCPGAPEPKSRGEKLNALAFL